MQLSVLALLHTKEQAKYLCCSNIETKQLYYFFDSNTLEDIRFNFQE